MDSPNVMSAVTNVLEELNSHNGIPSYLEFMLCIRRNYNREQLGITLHSFVLLIMQYKKNNA